MRSKLGLWQLPFCPKLADVPPLWNLVTHEFLIKVKNKGVVETDLAVQNKFIKTGFTKT